MTNRIMSFLIICLLVLSIVATVPMAAAEESPREVTMCDNRAYESFTPGAPNYNVKGIIFMMSNFYETLVRYDNGKIYPCLAESWDISEDGTVYTFHLRKNVTFTDGTPFDASVVKLNLDNIPIVLGENNGYFGVLTTLFKEIKVIDKYTVEMHLINPYYGTLYDLALRHPLAMLSPSAYKEDGTRSDDVSKTYGTGPYMYTGKNDGTTFTFDYYPGYWGEKPDVERFHVKAIPDIDTQLLALRSGEIDILFGTRQMTIDGMNEMKNAGFEVGISEAIGKTQYLAFNTQRAPFNDVNVRRAANHAVDKDSIIENLRGGLAYKAHGLFPKTMAYADVPVAEYDFNPDKAKEILENAGWIDSDGDGIREKDGVTLSGEFLYSNFNIQADDIALFICSQLADVGMDITPTQLEWSTFGAESREGNYDIVFNSTYGEAWDPHSTIANMSYANSGQSALSRAVAVVPDAEAYIQKLSTLADPVQIQEIYNYLLTEINDRAVFLPLMFSRETVLYNGDVIEDYTISDQIIYVHVAEIDLK